MVCIKLREPEHRAAEQGRQGGSRAQRGGEASGEGRVKI